MNQKISDLILYTTKSPTRYSETQAQVISLIENCSSSECKQVIDSIKKIIKDKRISPPQKVLALDLFHSCLMLKRADFVQISESRMISLIVRLAQKPSIDLFSDSGDTYEFKHSSERFLENLLNYIYVWANELNGANGKKTNKFSEAFYKLREVVQFTQIKSRKSINQRGSISSVEESGYLQKILNTLEVLEDMDEPESNELGQELITTLQEFVPGLDMTLQRAVEQNKKSLSEKVSKVRNRVLRYTGPEISAKTHRESTISSKIIKCSTSSPLKARPSYIDLESCDLRLENEKLKKSLIEKEDAVKNLTQTVQNLQSRMKVLEESFNKTKELLLSKEQECAECHVVKDSLKRASMDFANEHSMLMEFAQKNAYSAFATLPVMSTAMSCPVFDKTEEAGSSESEIFRLCLTGRSDLLLENNLVRVTFEGSLKDQIYEFVLKVQNISEFTLTNLESDVDRGFGYDFKQKQTKLVALAPDKTSLQEFSIKIICETHTIPTVSLKFDISDRFLEYIFEVPVTIASFAKPIHYNTAQLWSEFELLAFDSESKCCKCDFSFRRCRKLLKLSPNCNIFTKKKLSTLPDLHLLACFSLSSLIFILFSLNTLNKSAQIELRSDSQSLRKIFFTLIINQISL